jgi:hypothetical protein
MYGVLPWRSSRESRVIRFDERFVSPTHAFHVAPRNSILRT